MKFIRTVSTRRLLASMMGLVIAVGAGTAIAVAAGGTGPVPRAKPLATALHDALTAPAVTGITADISFTNNLIGASNFAGGPRDPILQGATGRLWLGDHRLRLELQSSIGDAQIVVDHNSFWISDPSANTVYKGTLPAQKNGGSAGKPADHAIPTIAQIQADLNKLMRHADLSGATPTDVGGQPAYSVRIAPKHDGGLLGSAQIAWDALRGVPLQAGIYARNNPTPVLQLSATNITYGPVPASDLNVSPPAGAKVVKVNTANTAGEASARAHEPARMHRHTASGAAVAKAVPFTLVAPAKLVGLPRQTVKLLDWGGKPAALVTYGENLGGIAVIEQPASAQSAASAAQSSGQRDRARGLSLPTVSINGASGQELSTALGTVLRFSRGGVAYTVLGSVPAVAAEAAARAL